MERTHVVYAKDGVCIEANPEEKRERGREERDPAVFLQSKAELPDSHAIGNAPGMF